MRGGKTPEVSPIKNKTKEKQKKGGEPSSSIGKVENPREGLDLQNGGRAKKKQRGERRQTSVLGQVKKKKKKQKKKQREDSNRASWVGWTQTQRRRQPSQQPASLFWGKTIGRNYNGAGVRGGGVSQRNESQRRFHLLIRAKKEGEGFILTFHIRAPADSTGTGGVKGGEETAFSLTKTKRRRGTMKGDPGKARGSGGI